MASENRISSVIFADIERVYICAEGDLWQVELPINAGEDEYSYLRGGSNLLGGIDYFAYHNKKLYVASLEGIWEITDGKPGRLDTGRNYESRCGLVVHKGKLYDATEDGIFETLTGERIFSWSIEALCSHQERLFYGNDEGIFELLRPHHDKLVIHTGGTYSLVSHEGELYAGLVDGILQVFSKRLIRTPFEPDGHDDYTIALSSHDSKLLAGSEDHGLRSIDIDKGIADKLFPQIYCVGAIIGVDDDALIENLLKSAKKVRDIGKPIQREIEIVDWKGLGAIPRSTWG